MKRVSELGDNLLSICQEDGIDLIIPTIDTDLLVLSENKARSEVIGTHVLISGPDKIRLCRDKNLTSQFFIDCGLKAPFPVNDMISEMKSTALLAIQLSSNRKMGVAQLMLPHVLSRYGAKDRRLCS